MPRVARIERKTEYFPCVGGEIKATNDQKGIVEGYLNYIGNIDFGDDRTMPGAFKKTLQDCYARKARQSLDFLVPYLWNHDYSIPPVGGIFEANEDRRGLYVKVQLNLDSQLGREIYSGFKSGFLKKQSMGYKAIQVDWVKEDGKSIRNLLEVALMEGSATIFPMNDLAQVDTVKNRSIFAMSYSTKGSASGKTTWPLADRNTTWDAGQAKKDIQAWAGDDKGKMAQCFFWVAKSPPTILGDCKLPFVAKSGGEMKAIPQGIISCAGVIQGAMGGANIDDVDGVKKKIATYYNKMDMTPPWEKGAMMDIWTKDYAESYQQTNQQDWVSDLWNLWYPLRNEIITAFQTGDTPVEDVQKALDQFSAATIAYVQQGVALDMTEYLQPDDTGPMPMYMSTEDNPETKAGRAISDANHAKLTKAAEGIAGYVKEIKDVLARARSAQLQGYPLTMSTDEQPEQKTEDATDDDEATRLNKVRAMIDDLAATLQFQNADKGI